MSDDQKLFDVVVIGGGPGGYVAAIRCAQLGLSVACVEKEKALGGTCLRIGCIPSKELLESSHLFAAARDHFGEMGIGVDGPNLDLAQMMKRKDGTVRALTGGIDGLFKKNKVARFFGHGRVAGPGKVEVEAADGKKEVLEAGHIILASGSHSAPLKGVELDGDRIGTSTEALSYPEVPKHLVVIGAGAIGLELGSVWQRLGAKVTVLEYMDRIVPGCDAEIAKAALKRFKKQGLEFQLGVKVTGATVKGKTCTVTLEGGDPITCDRVLLAVGRVPNTGDLGLETVGVTTDARGRIEVDDQLRTKAERVWAIGDAIPGPMLAHKAEEEGVAVAERIATGHGHVNYDVIPNVVYTEPEIAGVGKTEEELREAGIPFRKGSFPFIGNGRARVLGDTQGMVKVLAHEQTDRILGVHIVGKHAGDLIAECAVAMEFGASAEDLARTCHAHPTLAETVKEAALAVAKRSIHS